MTTKLLPTFSPVIHGRMYYAFPLCLFDKDPLFEQWLMSRFVQLQSYSAARTLAEGVAELRFHYVDDPTCFTDVLDVRKISLEGMSASDIQELLIEGIARNSYAYVYVDKYEVPDNPFYGKRHVTQESLVFGYELDSKTFHILGFKAGRDFGGSVAPFDSLTAGVVRSGCLHMYWISPKPMRSGSLGMNQLMASISQYLHSTVANGSETGLVYGLDCYDSLSESLRLVPAKEGAVVTNIAYLHILWEHKKLMLDRMNCIFKGYPGIKDRERIADQYGQLIKDVVRLRNGLIRYEMTKSDKILKDGVEQLGAIQRSERLCLSTLVDEMKNELAAACGADYLL